MLKADSKLYKHAVKRLQDRGVSIEAIAELVLELQNQYVADLTLDECVKSVKKVLKKREVQNAVLTGIELDELCEQGKLSSPLQEIIEADESLYGIDEVLALAIVNVYGSIGLTNFGYVDKLKPGLIGDLDKKKHKDQTNTFLDDIVGAIVAAAASRIAHSNPDVSDIMQ